MTSLPYSQLTNKLENNERFRSLNQNQLSKTTILDVSLMLDTMYLKNYCIGIDYTLIIIYVSNDFFKILVEHNHLRCLVSKKSLIYMRPNFTNMKTLQYKMHVNV